MRSRTFREGSVGLLILVGLFVFGGVILWLRGLNPGSKSFKVTIEFANVAGLQEGAPVRYRGVNVGRITSVQPGPNGVEVGIEISPPDLIIPKNAAVEANQAGLIGEAYIEITPRQPLSPQAVSAKPLDSNCNNALIVCHKSRLQGEIGISPDALIRYSIRFAELYSDPKFFNKVETVLGNTAEATKEITQLTREFTSLTRMVKQDLSTFSATAKAAAQAADKIGLTADQVNSLLVANRGSLVSTLENLNQTSAQLRVSVGRLSPVLDRVEQGELLRNLETLSANAAQASANLRDVSVALNNPTNLVVLQETLDSARATFQNAQKITADLDELTGDPAFRNNLRNLVNGLSGLVSSTQELQQQAQLAQILPPVAEAVNSSGTTLSNADRPEETANQPVLQSSPLPLDKVGTRN